MKSLSASILFLLLSCSTVFSQGEIDDQDKVFYRDESTFAATLNNYGISGGYRYARRIDGFRKKTYEVEFAYVKLQKESKLTLSSSQQIGNSFVYGKLNAFFTLHCGIGFQKEIYSKLDKGSISVRYFCNIGPTIGFLKPYYYMLMDSTGYYRFDNHTTSYERKAPFYVGLDELSLVPGIYSKFGFTFEFGKLDRIFNAIETGVIIDLFPKKIPILDNDQNQFAFFSFFLSYRFGKIIDTQFKEKKILP
jgi:hypothetical protein